MYEEEIFETILDQRGVEDIEHFLHPTEDDLLPLDSMKNIEHAYETVKYAIENGGQIYVLFDSDTDGITAGAIMYRYLKNFTDNILCGIPEGKKHGLKGMELARFYSSDLLIVVDSLDSTIDYYRDLVCNANTDIVIFDHHFINPEIPYDEYTILVSSQREYGNPQLSGAGVTWKFCKYFDSKEGTDYSDYLIDLAACGLVADLSDMTVMENRYIVSKGLEKINNLAIKKIIGSFDFNSTAISFSVAPIVNASNRIGKNDSAMKAFISDDNKIVLAYMKELKKCRQDQNEEVERIMPSAIKQCENQKDKKVMYVIIESDYGISGLLANKLLEKYQRPIIVVKSIFDKYIGSMRAIGVEDFRKICNDSGFARADGHELASGIEINKKNFEAFLKYIEENTPELEFDKATDIDIQIELSDITRRLIDKVKEIDFISGEGFKPVRVLVNDITDYEIGQMSDYKHIVIKPSDYLNIIKWNFNGSFEEMEDASMMNDELQVVGTLDSGFLARKFMLKLICDDIMEAS